MTNLHSIQSGDKGFCSGAPLVVVAEGKTPNSIRVKARGTSLYVEAELRFADGIAVEAPTLLEKLIEALRAGFCLRQGQGKLHEEDRSFFRLQLSWILSFNVAKRVAEEELTVGEIKDYVRRNAEHIDAVIEELQRLQESSILSV